MLKVTIVRSEVDLQQELVARHLVGLIRALGLQQKVLSILQRPE